MNDNIALVLSTRLKEPKKLLIDGEEFQLLGIDHLTPTDEAEVMALFARYAYKSAELDSQPNVVKGKVIAEAMKDARIALITKLTDIPKAIAAKLPLTAQVILLEAIQAEVEAVNDGDDDDDTTVPEQEDGEY